MDTLSFDQTRSLVSAAIREAYGKQTWVVDIYPGSVIFESEAGEPMSHRQKMFMVSYVVGANSVITLADDKTEVQERRDWQPVAPVTFSLDSGVVDGSWVIRSGKLFEAGDYPDKNFSVSEAELDDIAASFTPAPNDLEHIKTVITHDRRGNPRKDNPIGETLNIRKEGTALFGDVKIPKWLDDTVGKDPLGVSLTFDKQTKRIIRNALTLTPRITDAQVVAAFNDSRNRENVSTSTKPTLVESFLALFNRMKEEEGGNPVVVTPAAAPQNVEESAEFKALKAQNEALAAQVQASNDAKVSEAAAAFAKDAIDKNKALPTEGLEAMFAQALKDDNAGTVTFSADGSAVEGDRVKQLRASVEARIPHNLTKEKLATFALPLEGGDTPKPVSINPQEIFEARKAGGKN